ncbi:MAG: hypothetical protein SF123_25540, partial [Chloroflexota bacterium]|nr:hypothetical protein [Chloroflexota bacterium]
HLICRRRQVERLAHNLEDIEVVTIGAARACRCVRTRSPGRTSSRRPKAARRADDGRAATMRRRCRMI